MLPALGVRHLNQLNVSDKEKLLLQQTVAD